MPTKTKSSASSPVKKTAKKAVVVKKQTVAKKKAAAAKTSVAKKRVAKKMPAAKKAAVEKMPDVVLQFAPEAEPVVEVHHKYIWIGACRNCEHMPMAANKLVAVLSITIAILSGLLISTSLPFTFKMPSISIGSLTDWITPDSSVRHL